MMLVSKCKVHFTVSLKLREGGMGSLHGKIQGGIDIVTIGEKEKYHHRRACLQNYVYVGVES